MKLNKYRLFWTDQGVATDFRPESVFRRLLAWLGLDRGRLYRGVRILYAYDVHIDGECYTVVKLRCATGDFSVGCHPKGLRAEEAIDRIMDEDSSRQRGMREAVLMNIPTADGAPWELHLIKDPEARTSALAAFSAETTCRPK